MHFMIDWRALILVLVFLVFFFLISRKRQSLPYVYFSNLSSLKEGEHGWRSAVAHWPRNLKIFTLLFFALAYIDPYFGTQSERLMNKSMATEGIAFYLLLDHSGSMSEQVVEENRESTEFTSKMDLLKRLTATFIKGDPKTGLRGRQNDLIGLVAFARIPVILSPLTIDHQSVLDELNKIQVVTKREEDGTGIGYAIYKTANIIAATKHFAQDLIPHGKPAYDLKGSAIILVTDGFQNPNYEDRGNPIRTMDIQEGAEYAKKYGVHVYIVNIDPSINEKEYAPQRRIMQRAAELTGGKFFPAEDPKHLQEVYAAIDNLEKTVVPLPPGLEAKQKIIRIFSLAPFFLVMGMLALFFSILLETTALRKVP